MNNTVLHFEGIILESYLREHYGICKRPKCACIKTGTIGSQCVDWLPTDAKTYEELGKWQEKLRE